MKFSSVQSCSHVWLFVTPLTVAQETSLSPTLGPYSNSCPLSRWCHPTISYSVIPFSSCPQSFPASGSFPISHFFASGGQSIGVPASASVLPMNIQDWLPLGWTGWISLQSKGLSIIFSNVTVQKHQYLSTTTKKVKWVPFLLQQLNGFPSPKAAPQSSGKNIGSTQWDPTWCSWV